MSEYYDPFWGDPYYGRPHDPDKPLTGPSEYSWGEGFQPAFMEGRTVAEGAMYQGKTPPCTEQISVEPYGMG